MAHGRHDPLQLYSAVFDSQETKSRFAVPINRGISGYVATSGKIMNIKDVYDDPRFNNAIDIKTGYRTKSMLCVPICGPENQKVIGVTTLINKLEMPYFTVEDEEVFMAFSVFCGLAIHKSLLMSSLKNHRNMLSVTMELMSYHVTSKPEEVHAFQASMERQGVQMQFDDLASPLFDAHDYHLNDALVYIMLQMFKDLGYPQKYEISDQKLLTYALTIRRNYRDNAYHNFTHAVAVSHAIYYLAKTGISRKYLEEIEEFSMLLAAFNHDIDHRGTNNAFQKSAHTALADFYSTSTMERHHFNHAMTILNTPHHNIFERLSPNEYQRCLKTFEHGILATDLALYFKNRKPTEALEGCYNKADSQHRELLRGLIMTCSDLSSMTKRWEGSQHTADQVYSEFFEQGDKERALGLPFSSPLMDRSNTSKIPKMQFEFYGAIVAPAFALLAKLVPEVQPLYDSVLANQSRWKVLMDSNVPYEIHQPSH
ncbi:uncharacterized protein BJ171DRAFT_420001 [Polychytrium aggregatum]|uniref:uncharacterized protein n=1 Tax=Polychytrium aggregatum TaxID=110093 RepID=UPI0022FDB388|nr:uncharacterized protein BJ171DRAFT_436029 [Polychytrium aggregatum]XP_052970475.1 uncharacterized protein BJ171DRAFT_420001 [Polychytrium aggregatum]KAI9188461.1 hypothetical protein BJ171DRAFT_436029 [Polychytrium aggregatum]KAI9208395.1 hypothetical protein BJ171DRAFT_420001 [Polychytrium aggregatum]